jgi:hypothetical protein
MDIGIFYGRDGFFGKLYDKKRMRRVIFLPS